MCEEEKDEEEGEGERETVVRRKWVRGEEEEEERVMRRDGQRER